MQFIQARHYTRNANSSREIKLIVIHDMEAPEKPSTAEDVAKWFAGSNAPQASAHYCVDNNSAVQCVQDKDIAWAAPGANHDGLHFELAGYASQTRSNWLDVYDKAELDIVANLVAHRCVVYHVPMRKISPADVRAGRAGICGHLDITESGIGGAAGTHRDPGPNFPWDYFIGRVVYMYHKNWCK